MGEEEGDGGERLWRTAVGVLEGERGEGADSEGQGEVVGEGEERLLKREGG